MKSQADTTASAITASIWFAMPNIFQIASKLLALMKYAQPATISAVLHNGFDFLWTGFYRVVTPTMLRVGPYQGTIGCMDIAFGKGVCGTAAAGRRTVIVPDVDLFPGHIACDARARSEIVVPVLNASGELTAVLDIDSDAVSTFDADDARGLETIVARFLR